jgi:DNA-binding response OmpR family regulator
MLLRNVMRLKKSKVLLVEDDTGISKLISDYLGAQGYDVTAMVDGPVCTVSNWQTS